MSFVVGMRSSDTSRADEVLSLTLPPGSRASPVVCLQAGRQQRVNPTFTSLHIDVDPPTAW